MPIPWPMNEPYRCASLLKPLYAWVAGPTYEPYGRRAVTVSDNEATDLLVQACGGLDSALDRIFERTGVALPSAETWGRVLVTSEDVELAYVALLSDSGWYSENVLRWMRDVVPAQRFGIAEGVPMKAGWDLSPDEPFIRTHAVALMDDRAVAVLTALPISEQSRREWNLALDSGGADAVIPIHWRIAGSYLMSSYNDAGVPVG